MNIEDKLKSLDKINQVDAPVFLLTRIHQAIENLETKPVSNAIKWGFALATILLLAINLTLFNQLNKQQNELKIKSVANSMELSNSNYLYHD